MVQKRKKTPDELNNDSKNVQDGHTQDTAIVISEDEDFQERNARDIKKVKLSDDKTINTPVEKESPIKLFYCPALEDTIDQNPNYDTVMFSELIGVKDLKETYQFNFTVDLEFFLTFLHPEFVKKKKKITFITGSTLFPDENPSRQLLKRHFSISEVIAHIPNRYGTHHTKMMINFFEDDSLEIVIMTCNITKLDLGGLTQMCWRSGRLSKCSKKECEPLTIGGRFKRDIKNYLLKYKNGRMNTLASLLEEYNFKNIEVELISSSPGSYDIANLEDDDEIYGYGKLYQVLRRNDLLIDNIAKNEKYNVLAQASAISFPFATSKGNTSSIFTHLLCPLFFASKLKLFPCLEPGLKSSILHQKNLNYQPSIIFPSVRNVADNCVGFGAGGAIHFNYTQSYLHKNQYEQNIKPYLSLWDPKDGVITYRENVSPHVKLYMVDNGDNWSSLKWVFMGSHNLSKQAWGGVKRDPSPENPSKYDISSYELGVLVPGNNFKLTPSYRSNKLENKEVLPIRLPFKLPPKKYNADDKPWSTSVKLDNSIKDKYGNTFN